MLTITPTFYSPSDPLRKISNRIIKAAQDLTCAQNLRAYDAVQLATALYAVNALKSPRLIFVTADARLEAAAIAEGMLTDNPLNH